MVLFVLGIVYALVVIRIQFMEKRVPGWYHAAVTLASLGLGTAILAVAAPGVPEIMPLACAIYSTSTLAAIVGTESYGIRPSYATGVALLGLVVVWTQSAAGASGKVAPLLVWGGLQLGLGLLLDVTWRLSRVQLDKRMARLAMLSDVAHQLGRTTDLTDVATAVLEAFSATFTDFNWGGILIFDPDRGNLESLPVSLSPSGVVKMPTDDPPLGIKPGEGLAGEAYVRGEVLHRSTAAQASHDQESRRGATNIEIERMVGTVMAAIALPLRSGSGEVIGVVSLASSSQEYRWTEDDLIMAEGIADQAGVAIERGHLYEEQKTQAMTDPLTSLPNRRDFERVLAGHDLSVPFTVLAIDLDNLKMINDEYGHEAGDRVVRLVGTTLRAGLRANDSLARVGGDEFAAFLPGTDLATATEIADRLTWSMHGVAVPFGSARISSGCAAGDAGAEPRQVWSQADDALYRAKASGRNRVEVAEEANGRDHPRTVRWAELLPEILTGHLVQAAYQPVVALPTGVVMGFEALARPTTHADDAAVDGLFAAALHMGLGRDLDWLCRRAAVQNAHVLPEGSTIFINVGVPALLDPLHDVDQMLLLLRWARREPETVVLEITEREGVNDLDRFREVLATYRQNGFRFAMDDVGEGHSTLEILAAGAPEFIKIASSLTGSADQPGPRAAVEALVTFARSSGAIVIAEGIETRADLDRMMELGADLGQGFLLGRPAIGGVHPDASLAVPTVGIPAPSTLAR